MSNNTHPAQPNRSVVGEVAQQPIKKITANDAIILMLNSINQEKRDQFYKAAEEYCSSLSKNGDTYYRLQRLLREKPLKMILLSELSNDIKKLISQRELPDDAVYLNSDIKAIIDELLIEWNHAEAFRFHNLGVRNKILLHGPTGNGKTTIARYIAKLSGLPFVEVNADIMIDSHIGNSGYNIHKLLTGITQPCVLFWDEVDTIGRARGKGSDSAAGLENERMVNSILVNIEKLNNDVVFIGATNRKGVLDSAFLRRFDLQIEISAPSENEKNSFAHQLAGFYKLPDEFIPSDITTHDNFSEIKRRLTEAARSYILSTLHAKPTQP